jgi:hypothetical protein
MIVIETKVHLPRALESFASLFRPFGFLAPPKQI